MKDKDILSIKTSVPLKEQPEVMKVLNHISKSILGEIKKNRGIENKKLEANDPFLNRKCFECGEGKYKPKVIKKYKVRLSLGRTVFVEDLYISQCSKNRNHVIFCVESCRRVENVIKKKYPNYFKK